VSSYCMMINVDVKTRLEGRLSEFATEILRKVVGFERNGVTKDWRKLHYEGLRNFALSPNIQVVVFCIVMPCSVVGDRCFEGPCCLHLHSKDGGSMVFRNVDILP